MSDEFDSFFNEIGQPQGVTIYSGLQANVFQLGQDHCIKVYKKFTLNLDDIKRIDGIINNLINEKKLTHTLKFDVIFNTKQYAVQMKRGNNLLTYFNFNRRSLFEKCSLMYQMVVAVDELHKNNITHLDIKPDNMVLFDQDGYQDLKLIDFGLSQNKLIDIIKKGGTDMYVCPDLGTLTYKADNWALGVIFYLMILGYYEIEMPLLDFQLLSQELIYSTIQSQIRCQNIGTKLAGIVSQLLNPQPTERMELSAVQVAILEVLNLIPEISMFNSIFKFEYQTEPPHWLFDNYNNLYNFELTHKLSLSDKALTIHSKSLYWTNSQLSGNQEEDPANLLKYEFGSHKIFNTHLTISLCLNSWVFINKQLIQNLQQDQFLNCVFCLNRYAEQCIEVDKQDFQHFCLITQGFTFKEHPSDLDLKQFVSQMMLVYFNQENSELEKCVQQILVDDDFSNLPENLMNFQNKNKFMQINSQIMREFNSQYYFTINCHLQQELSSNIEGLAESDNNKENFKGQKLWIYYLPQDFELLNLEYHEPRRLQAIVTALVYTSSFLYNDGKRFSKIHNSAINFESGGYSNYRCIQSQIIPLSETSITESEILKPITDYIRLKTKQSVINQLKFDIAQSFISFSHYFKAADVTPSQQYSLLSSRIEHNSDFFATWVIKTDISENKKETI